MIRVIQAGHKALKIASGDYACRGSSVCATSDV